MRRLLVTVLALAGCAASGMGDATRKDVAARMQSIRPGVSSCYEEALKRDREVRGTMVVQFTTEPKTGKFVDVQIVRTDVNDRTLQGCVTGHVANLKLEKPTRTRQSIEYPLQFTPID